MLRQIRTIAIKSMPNYQMLGFKAVRHQPAITILHSYI